MRTPSQERSARSRGSLARRKANDAEDRARLRKIREEREALSLSISRGRVAAREAGLLRRDFERRGVAQEKER